MNSTTHTMFRKKKGNNLYFLTEPYDESGDSLYRQLGWKDRDDNETPTTWYVSGACSLQTAKKTWPRFTGLWFPPKRLPISDHPNGAWPGELFSQVAYDAIVGLFSSCGDFLPIEMEHGSPYWLYLDWNTMKFSFNDAGKYPCAFHVADDYRLVVTQTVKDAIEKAKLSGFVFVPVD